MMVTLAASDKFNTSQRLADPAKKVWFSDLELQEKCGQINREEYIQRNESQNIEN